MKNDRLECQNLKITSLSPHEAQQISNLYEPYFGACLDVDRLELLFRKYIALKVTVDEELVGFCYSIDFAPDIIILLNIFVSEKYRNIGLGTKLLTAFEQHASTAGYSAVMLSNSIGYKSIEKKDNPTNFYLRQYYTIIDKTEQTVVYRKVIN